MTHKIKPRAGVLDAPLYVGGTSTVAGKENIVKLSSNENPYGTPDGAKAAFSKAAHALHRYPDTTHEALRRAIGEINGLDPARILCGTGSDEIITFLCQAYAGKGDEVIYTEHGFSMYKISATVAGATPVCVPERERVVDVDAILDACTKKTKLVFIANPANPTGTMIGSADVSRLADGLPPQAILVLDGAYAEYVDGFDGGAAFVEARDNVVMTRTFSKIYGLGGIRVGWGYGPQHIIEALSRLRGPFNLSEPQLAAAEAAVRDTAWVEKCREDNARLRAWLAEALMEHGVPSDTSCANFILARFQSRKEAEDCDDYLKEQGLIVRRVAGYGLPNCLRITVGDEASCRQVAHAIGQFREKRK